MAIHDEIASLADQIERLKRDPKKFRPYIDNIHFPKFRNFFPDSVAHFTFPLTVLVGQNGSGKTSLLHALSGAPEGRSVGNHWFSTNVDPIVENAVQRISSSTAKRTNLSEGQKSAFWYEYHDSDGSVHQVLKTRISRKGDPDYWEPSRPVERYGMTRLKQGERHPAIKMPVEYLNFRTQLTAFDRCFYFCSPLVLKRFEKTKHWKTLISTGKSRSVRVQDFLRSRSRRLKRALLDGKTITAGRHPMHEVITHLSPEELADLSEITGREYRAGHILHHRFYDGWGVTVRFETFHHTYSEAFAGSGEAAVARLVNEVSSAGKGTLLLLDEPETSLHPGAQLRLLKFLLRNVKEKKLQVVVSTHSPEFVRHLPNSAIKVLSAGPDGRVRIEENVHREDAFYFIGHHPENVTTIVVEDVLAKKLVDAVALSIGAEKAARLNVEFRPGGASAMRTDAAVFMLNSRKPFLLFDGDNRPSNGNYSVKDVPLHKTYEDLDRDIKEMFGQSIAFREDSNATSDVRKNTRIDFLRYVEGFFRYLPFQCPEEALWDDNAAEMHLKTALDSDEKVKDILDNRIKQCADFKARFHALASAVDPVNAAPSAQGIGAIHALFLTRFCSRKEAFYVRTRALLEEVLRND